jgi:hypothetical protein
MSKVHKGSFRVLDESGQKLTVNAYREEITVKYYSGDSEQQSGPVYFKLSDGRTLVKESDTSLRDRDGSEIFKVVGD